MRLLLALLFATPAFAVDVYFAPSKDVPKTIENAIDGADERLAVAIYSFSDTRLRAKLKAAAKRGVVVRLILHNARKESDLADSIEDAGGDVKYVTKVMHHKFVIADQELLVTGSANWSRSAYTRYDEDLLRIDEREYVAAFQNEFEFIWENAKEYGAKRFEPLDSDESKADVRFTSANMETTTYKGEPTFRSAAELPGICGERLIQAIRSAESSIKVASAHFRRADLHNELLLAMERGVSVRMILDQQEFHYRTTRTPNAIYDEALALAGADVRYKVYSRFWDYRTALQLHCKFLVVDDREVLTGSLNWSENAELGTFENLISLTESPVVAKYADRFETIWRYGDGRLESLIDKVNESGGTAPCSFAPISLTGAELSELRRAYDDGACE
ncbi:MAG: phosphatidylserine/phosphatidylglycerophosphate/cardiolipin synthase family protein [Planctomycetota bacterium]